MAGKATAKALAYLASAAGTLAGSTQRRLPAIRVMARECGVSALAVQKAVSILREQGVLEVRPGRGVTVTGHLPVPAEAATHENAPVALRPRWRAVERQVQTDLLAGAYPSGSNLPALKVLAGRYGANYRTVRKAVEALAGQGVLTVAGRGYRVAGPALAGSTGAVVLIARADSVGGITIISERTTVHLKALEAECSRIGVRLLVYSMAYGSDVLYSGAGESITAARLLRSAHVLGVIVWGVALPTEQVAGLCRALGAPDRPVAVLDETGAHYGLLSSAPPWLRVYSLAVSPGPARTVGRFLLSRGHRRIAYLSLNRRGDLCSANRLQGLQSAFASAGIRDAVVALTAETLPPRFELTTELRRLRDSAEIVRASLAEVPENLAQSADLAIQNLLRHLEDLRRAADFRVDLFPMLERLAADEEVSAWVAFRDATALSCLEFLRLRRIPVPHRVSVVGFDDTDAAFAAHLTSYNFNGPAYMAAMVRWVLSTPSPRSTAPAGPVDIPGYLVERGSTGRGPVRGGGG